MKKIIIAIDGYSSTGKSTIAKQVAKALNYIYVDTGAMYRAVAYYALQNKIINKDGFNSEALINVLNDITITFKYNEVTRNADVYLNDINIEKEIRTLEVSSYVSIVSKVPEVRHKLVEQQQKMGENKGVIMDGRDIGSVVFPNAELKIFMTASNQVRAQRRYNELISKGEEIVFEDVLNNLVTRDKIDSSRTESPLIKTQDAIEIDNSDLTIEEQIEKILLLVKNIINQ